jgi:phosphohistidine phosphatase
MKLYLFRHAHALAEAEDPARPLSAKGRELMQAVARGLRRRTSVEVAEVWHSPLVRARETAELLAEGLRLRVRLREVPGLLPEDSPAEMATALGHRNESLMLVGHEPHLSSLAGQLLGIDPERSLVEFKKGTGLCLDRVVRGAPWTLEWLLPPRFAGEPE